MYHKTVGIGDVDYQLFPIRLHYLFNRELPEILRFIIDCLLVVHGKRLVKITVTVQKSYGTKAHIAVRRLFQVIPANIPKPPEYILRTSSKPYSMLK